MLKRKGIDKCTVVWEEKKKQTVKNQLRLELKFVGGLHLHLNLILDRAFEFHQSVLVGISKFKGGHLRNEIICRGLIAIIYEARGLCYKAN